MKWHYISFEMECIDDAYAWCDDDYAHEMKCLCMLNTRGVTSSTHEHDMRVKHLNQLSICMICKL